MVNIKCLACAKNIRIPQYIDTEKYEGQVVCQECEALLHLKLVKGKVQKYRIIERKVKRETTPIKINFVPASELNQQTRKRETQ